MWTLQKQFRFEAAHRLPLHDGKCQRLHGHSWVGYVTVVGGALIESGPKSGMVIDYGDISSLLKSFVDDHLDHWYLNESTKLVNPTSEELARWIYNEIKFYLPGLKSVTIEETCTSRCEYAP
jgi:6-pyruvoyltetrahydropterin/6-carboxytetrahydropterin synthase